MKIQSYYHNQLIHSARANPIPKGSCITAIITRAIQAIKDLFNAMCNCGKKPIRNPTVPLPVILPNPNPVAPPIVAQPPMVAAPIVAQPPVAPAANNQIQLPDDEIKRIEELSYEEVTDEIDSFDVCMEEHRSDLEEQNQLALDERDPEIVESCQHELQIADGRLIALQARKAHLDQIQLPREELARISRMSYQRADRKNRDLNLKIQGFLLQLNEARGEERERIKANLDRSYVQLRYVGERLDWHFQQVVNENPQVVEIPLSRDEQTAIDILSLSQVNEQIGDEVRREIAGVRLEALKARKAHLEVLELGQEDLTEISRMDREQVARKSAQCELAIWGLIGVVRVAEGAQRRQAQRDLDDYNTYLIHLEAQHSFWNQLGPEVVELPWKDFQQAPLPPQERQEIQIKDLQEVNNAIDGYAQNMNQLRANYFNQHIGQNHDYYEEELSIALAYFAALHMRKEHLETFVIPQDELDQIPDMDPEELEREINENEGRIRHMKQELNQDLAGRRLILGDLDKCLIMRDLLNRQRVQE